MMEAILEGSDIAPLFNFSQGYRFEEPESLGQCSYCCGALLEANEKS